MNNTSQIIDSSKANSRICPIKSTANSQICPIKTHGNMYTGVMTWNPLGGKCIHNCHYCYVDSWKNRLESHRIKYSGEPRIYYSEFKKKFKGTVFVVSMNDLFAANVPDDIIIEIIKHTKKYELDCQFLFQSKNVERMYHFWYTYKHNLFPINSIFCTTMTTATALNLHHASFMKYFPIRHITIEPIEEFNLSFFRNILIHAQPHQINIGADSKNKNLAEPKTQKILDLIKICETFTKVIIKKNLKRLL